MLNRNDPPELAKYPEYAARAAGVPVFLILRDNRQRKVVRPRWAAMVVAYENGYNVSQIARAFRRDRTTVLHALSRMGAL